ncbi:acetyl-CoA carboxylase biotin carboxylase subunit [Acuticoccus kandeliae]|uniref:acetyl-CoA carboxylase biotin carboxylase subunit n=1 Tax=Acuticoccus kandeliae TaxID=2073160 RepID=UPI000D3EC922|nr:acetyl-CoA carboxylase biotin carboxylase subunit [Acuticoccus kandeliae]
MAIGTLFVANRGEIAVRIIRAARALGIRTVQAHSAADATSLAVQIADEAALIGPPAAAKSYLNIDNIIEAAKAAGADAIHPGYGFLAENATFAARVAEAGMIFVGPSADVISKMGDKVAAREAAKAAGVPTVPGSEGRVPTLEEGRAIADSIGYPVIIKAAAGGGGRGIRVANDAAEFERLFAQASGEAAAAFGDGGLYVEKVVYPARHVEVQILGDGTRAVHLFERECSLQRRRQKVWEEAPSAALSPDVRAALTASAVRLAQDVGYSGAGTLEYLYDEESGDFYFIEMNTRIQVEHPVTEFVTGIDLVGAMLKIAGGSPLPYRQDEIALKGHAIEVRLNAEDPANNFMPFPGKIEDLRVPGGPGVRWDSMLFTGYDVPPFYDSLLGKLIVWGEDREAALDRLGAALSELTIAGLKTTQPLFTALLKAPEVRRGEAHITWLETWLENNAKHL